MKIWTKRIDIDCLIQFLNGDYIELIIRKRIIIRKSIFQKKEKKIRRNISIRVKNFVPSHCRPLKTIKKKLPISFLPLLNRDPRNEFPDEKG